MMKSQVLTREDAYRIVDERLKSREWWAIATCEWSRYFEVIHEIETMHYSGDAGVDFEIILDDTGAAPVWCVLMKKSRMTLYELATHLEITPGSINENGLLMLTTIPPEMCTELNKVMKARG